MAYTIIEDLEYMKEQLSDVLSYGDVRDSEYIYMLKRDINKLEDELWVQNNEKW